MTQTTPAPQLAPLAETDQVVVDEEGAQAWHGFAGFTAPEAYVVPAMKHSVTHAPLPQIWPAPQLVPAGTSDHALVEDAGAHTWQMFAGLGAEEA